MRPGWPGLYAVLCAIGVAGALVTTADTRVGLAILVVAFLALAADVSGLAPVARCLTPRRATQCVVSEPLPLTRGDVRVRLIVTAALDTGRGGVAFRLAPLETRLRRLLRGHLSSPPAILCTALALLAAIAGARALGLDGGSWIGPVALVPRVVLVLGAAACLDIALAGPAALGSAGSAAVAAAVELVARLDAETPDHVAVELVLAGASTGGQLGMRAYVARRRRAARPRELAVLALGPCGPGALRFHRTEGLLLPARMHPGLVALARGSGLTGVRRGLTGAIVARRAGWPAIGMSATDDAAPANDQHPSAGGPTGIEPGAIGETVTHCLELVRALNRQL